MKTFGSLHQARESIDVGHPVFIAENIAHDARVSWPRRFIADDKPLGRILRVSSEAIDFALSTHRQGLS